MNRFNLFGLIFMAVIMIPNIVFALKHKNESETKKNGRIIEVFEQIGRYGCFAFMVINIPGVFFGWSSDESFAVYLIADSVLTAAYCAMWIVLRNNNGILRAFALSVIPSVIFLFSGIISRNIPLVVSAVVFAPAHIYISYVNAE